MSPPTSESSRDERATTEGTRRGRDDSLGVLARGGAVVAGGTGGLGALSMLGAFGPVSCSTSRSTTSDGVTTVSRECNAGIDYLFGAGGNAPVLFFWSIVLLALVGAGAAAAWTGRVRLTAVATALCAAVTVVGVFSIGWYFLLPTIALLTATVALLVEGRRPRDA
jgi:hypothetical protein